MNRKTILIIVAVVLVLCICCVGIVIVVGLMGGLTALGLTQPAADAGEAFMTALKDNDFDKGAFTSWGRPPVRTRRQSVR